MEYASGGELFDYIVQNQRVPVSGLRLQQGARTELGALR